jgi:hypothetical protein
MTTRNATYALIAGLTLASGSAWAAEQCYDFSNIAPGTEYAIDGSVPIPISIGEVRVRPLKFEGNEVAPASRFFRVADTQQIAGGAAPEMQGKNVSLQMIPSQPAKRITLKFSHQPGAAGERVANVEVNGEKHEWRGSFSKLDGKKLGQGNGATRFKVRQETVANSNWVSGELRLEGKSENIASFTIGAAELRLDDVCFEK